MKRPWIAVVLCSWLGGVAPIATVATTTMSSGCGCNAIQLVGGAELMIAPTVAGLYRVEIEAWGELRSVEVRHNGTRCEASAYASGTKLAIEACGFTSSERTDGISVRVSDLEQTDGPRQLTVRVFRDGVLVHTAQPALTYEQHIASGALCSGDAYTAEAIIALP